VIHDDTMGASRPFSLNYVGAELRRPRHGAGVGQAMGTKAGKCLLTPTPSLDQVEQRLAG
jgi:hypothetical protein